MAKQEKSNEKDLPQIKERFDLNIPNQRGGNLEKGHPNGGMNEGYQPTRNESPTPPGSENTNDKS